MLPRKKSTLYFISGILLVSFAAFSTIDMESVSNTLAKIAFFAFIIGGCLLISSVNFTPEQMRQKESDKK